MEWPKDRRIHVDQLTPQEAVQVMELTECIERIIIHLQLCLGLRRVEVLQMKVSDIMLGYINILGKGRLGRKRRTSPFHRDTTVELSYHHRIMEVEVSKMRRKNPDVVIPDSPHIYERAGQLHAYKRSFVDKVMARVSKKLGRKLTNHTLRRLLGLVLAHLTMADLFLDEHPVAHAAGSCLHRDLAFGPLFDRFERRHEGGVADGGTGPELDHCRIGGGAFYAPILGALEKMLHAAVGLGVLELYLNVACHHELKVAII